MTYDRYPARIVVLSNALALAIYALGFYILAGFGLRCVAAYAVYCLWIEYRILRRSCVNCCYYGQWCGLGKGRLCARLFAQGSQDEFRNRQITWRDVFPDFLVGLLPLTGGILLLHRHGFSRPLAAAMAAVVVLSFAGNAYVRGTFLCKYCRQRELGCPAQKLFGGEKE